MFLTENVRSLEGSEYFLIDKHVGHSFIPLIVSLIVHVFADSIVTFSNLLLLANKVEQEF